MPTPTDELNRLLDAWVYSRFPDHSAARLAIVAHFEKVTLTPEEAGHTVGIIFDDGVCEQCNAILAKLRLLSGSGQTETEAKP